MAVPPDPTPPVRPATPADAHGGAGGDAADWGPAVTGGRRGRRRRTVLLVALLLAALVALAVASPVLAALTALDRVAVPSLAGDDGDGVLHTLVIGSDSRDDLTPEQQAELGTGTVDGLRTDTLFILSSRGSQAAILGLPRDLWVERCDGSSGRINSAWAIGGPDCLVATVQSLTGIRLDHVVEVDFLGFVDLVGAVGGVEVCLDKPIKDPFAAIDLPAGCQTLVGRDALGYVRVRKIDNDLKRIERQQGFVAALAAKALTPAIILNPFRATAVARAGGGALTVDDGMGLADLLRLARGGRGLATGQKVTATVPVRDATIGGAAVLLPLDAAAQLFAAFADGTIFDGIGQPEDADG